MASRDNHANEADGAPSASEPKLGLSFLKARAKAKAAAVGLFQSSTESRYSQPDPSEVKRPKHSQYLIAKAFRAFNLMRALDLRSLRAEPAESDANCGRGGWALTQIQHRAKGRRGAIVGFSGLQGEPPAVGDPLGEGAKVPDKPHIAQLKEDLRAQVLDGHALVMPSSQLRRVLLAVLLCRQASGCEDEPFGSNSLVHSSLPVSPSL
ncbi:hypothetical protein CYMTET_29798 [Cymbomonas tetramitiformis]|uniref:Uncharacterized protein n=1 Tax=Cymbomonas tetramitiformis TaxID=36881 RepID=A0AAE0KUJ7_9CHLO|nr:hypothetical protein CYMTET_29798 [Cymbomonas tetramitiformis]